MNCLDCAYCFNQQYCTIRDEPITVTALCFMFTVRGRK